MLKQVGKTLYFIFRYNIRERLTCRQCGRFVKRGRQCRRERLAEFRRRRVVKSVGVGWVAVKTASRR